MQKKIEFIANTMEEAQAIAVEKLHISSDKIFVRTLGELPEGLNCEAVVDINLTLEGKKYLESILRSMNIGYKIEARSINNESEIHYIVDSYENSLLIGIKGKTLEAIQMLLRSLISSYTKDHIIVTLDIGGYRANRLSQKAKAKKEQSLLNQRITKIINKLSICLK